MKNYKGKNDKDLEKALVEERNSLRDFRFGIAGSKVRNVKDGKNTKKKIARILTELNTRK